MKNKQTYRDKVVMIVLCLRILIISFSIICCGCNMFDINFYENFDYFFFNIFCGCKMFDINYYKNFDYSFFNNFVVWM